MRITKFLFKYLSRYSFNAIKHYTSTSSHNLVCFRFSLIPMRRIICLHSGILCLQLQLFYWVCISFVFTLLFILLFCVFQQQMKSCASETIVINTCTWTYFCTKTPPSMHHTMWTERYLNVLLDMHGPQVHTTWLAQSHCDCSVKFVVEGIT